MAIELQAGFVAKGGRRAGRVRRPAAPLQLRRADAGQCLLGSGSVCYSGATRALERRSAAISQGQRLARGSHGRPVGGASVLGGAAGGSGCVPDH